MTKLRNSLLGVCMEEWEKMTMEDFVLTFKSEMPTFFVSGLFQLSCSPFILSTLTVKGKELPLLGAEINTDSHTAGISRFKKILLTPGLVGGSCRVDALAKHPYI